jgi:RimJ/RimL family protein N-acetyltransferase
MMRLPAGPAVVRSWQLTDLDAIVRHANNRRVSQWLRDRFPFPYERMHGQRFLEWASTHTPETVWAIEADGEAVGGIGIELQSDVERVSAEIGYWLGEAHWGRGIAPAAVVAVTDYAFRHFELTRLYALPFADNAGSIRVLEKAGYQREGRMPRSVIKDGVVKDQLSYGTYR